MYYVLSVKSPERGLNVMANQNIDLFEIKNRLVKLLNGKHHF